MVDRLHAYAKASAGKPPIDKLRPGFVHPTGHCLHPPAKDIPHFPCLGGTSETEYTTAEDMSRTFRNLPR